MLYPILIQQQNGHFLASALTVPGVIKLATTKDEALRSVQNAIMAQLSKSEIVYIDVQLPTPAPTPENEWVALTGIFADDETLEPMLAEIYANRDTDRDEEPTYTANSLHP